uniref:(California timema) hypothetical protein n=1 Tax=Timema californicum TaxID=61474 RepID=A0A7R9IYF1_TIMCA|nr:unnamed protein product [Timema californicum]
MICLVVESNGTPLLGRAWISELKFRIIDTNGNKIVQPVFFSEDNMQHMLKGVSRQFPEVFTDRLDKLAVEVDERCEPAFCQIKEVVQTNLSLAHFNPQYPVRLSVDGSDIGLSALRNNLDLLGPPPTLSRVQQAQDKQSEAYGGVSPNTGRYSVGDQVWVKNYRRNKSKWVSAKMNKFSDHGVSGLSFGSPLDKIGMDGNLHPGLRALFLKAHLIALSRSHSWCPSPVKIVLQALRLIERVPVPITAPELKDGGGILSFNNAVYTSP